MILSKAAKCPPPDLNGGGHYYRLIIALKNEPQPELQHSSRVCICSLCNRAKVLKIADIAVWGAKNHSVEKVESLSTELKPRSFSPERESPEDREVHIPVALRLEGIRAKITERARRRGSQR